MPSDAEQIAAIKTQTLTLIEEITAEPKPTYNVDGQMVAWEQYLEQLRQTVDWCNRKLASEEPFEFHSRGVT